VAVSESLKQQEQQQGAGGSQEAEADVLSAFDMRKPTGDAGADEVSDGSIEFGSLSGDELAW
jgi:hypothetical protein